MSYVDFANHVGAHESPEVVISLIDFSGSMGHDDWPPSRLDGAIQANKELIRAKLNLAPRDIMGLIGFGDAAFVLHPPVSLKDGEQSLMTALNRVDDTLGGTNITEAIDLAAGELNGMPLHHQLGDDISPLGPSFMDFLLGSPKEAEARLHERTRRSYYSSMTRRVILLSDGGHNALGFSPVKAANKLRETGVIIDCIGVGGTPDEIDEDTLKKIASRNPDGSVRYCFIGDKQRLIQKYRTLANHIRPA